MANKRIIVESASKFVSNVQVHVVVEKKFYEAFRVALKKLGYKTTAEYIREGMRKAVEKAENNRTSVVGK